MFRMVARPLLYCAALVFAMVLLLQPTRASAQTADDWDWPGFGYSDNYYTYAQEVPAYGNKLHWGIDLKAPAGTSVVAVADGTVVLVTRKDYPGATIVVRSTLPSGDEVFVLYGHLHKLPINGEQQPPMEVGQNISLGQHMGNVISWPSDASNSHLHLEIRTMKDAGGIIGYAAATTSDGLTGFPEGPGYSYAHPDFPYTEESATANGHNLDYGHDGFTDPYDFISFHNLVDGMALTEHTFFRGEQFTISGGSESGTYEIPEWFNDKTSSWAMPDNWSAIGYQDTGVQGPWIYMTKTDLDLRNNQLSDGQTSANDNMSSMEVGINSCLQLPGAVSAASMRSADDTSCVQPTPGPGGPTPTPEPEPTVLPADGINLCTSQGEGCTHYTVGDHGDVWNVGQHTAYVEFRGSYRDTHHVVLFTDYSSGGTPYHLDDSAGIPEPFAQNIKSMQIYPKTGAVGEYCQDYPNGVNAFKQTDFRGDTINWTGDLSNLPPEWEGSQIQSLIMCGVKAHFFKAADYDYHQDNQEFEGRVPNTQLQRVHQYDSLIVKNRKPDRPEQLSPAENQSIAVGEDVTFVWRSITWETGDETMFTYRLLLEGPTSITSDWQSGSSYAVEGLPAGTYSWHAIAKNSHGETGSSRSYPLIVYDGQPPTDLCPSPHNKFCLEYFYERNLTNKTAQNVVSNAVTNWGHGNPGHSLRGDNFSLRYTGSWDFDNATYEFRGGSDDGLRIYVDGSLVIDQWQDGGMRYQTATRQMSEGQHAVVVEFYEHGGDANIDVTWTKLEEPTPTPTPTPEPTPVDLGDTRIAYQQNSAAGIFVAQQDGSNASMISASGITEYNYPKISRSGEWLAFEGVQDSVRYIWITDLDGNNIQRLETGDVQHATITWHPDGKHILHLDALEHGRIVNIETNEITSLPDWPQSLFPNSFSTDGTKVIGHQRISDVWGIYQVDLDGSNKIEITTNASQAVHPQYSPDGTMITFTSIEDGGGNDIYLRDLATGEEINLTSAPGQSNIYSRFSPDGQHVIYNNKADGDRDLWRVDLEGSNRQVLTSTSPQHEAWSSWGVYPADPSLNGPALVFPTPTPLPDGAHQASGSGTINLTNDAQWYLLDGMTIAEEFGAGSLDITFTGTAENHSVNTTIYYEVAVDGARHALATFVTDSSASVVSQSMDMTAQVDVSDGQHTVQVRYWSNSATPSSVGGRVLTVSGEEVVAAPTPEPTPDASSVDSKIVYQQSSSTGNKIWIAREDGSDATQLTVPGFTRYNYPAYSPTGEWIAFEHEGVVRELWIVRPDGGDAKKVVGVDVVHATTTWHPDGQHILVSFASDSKVRLVNIDTGSIVEYSDWPANMWPTSYSPNGIYVLGHRYEGDNLRLYRMNADGTDPQVIDTSATKESHANYSRDGTKIVLRGIFADGDDVLLIDLATGQEVNLTPGTSSRNISPRFSPDGMNVIFSSNRRGGNWDMYRVSIDGSNLQALTETSNNEQWSSWGVYPPAVVEPTLTPTPTPVVVVAQAASMTGMFVSSHTPGGVGVSPNYRLVGVLGQPFTGGETTLESTNYRLQLGFFAAHQLRGGE